MIRCFYRKPMQQERMCNGDFVTERPLWRITLQRNNSNHIDDQIKGLKLHRNQDLMLQWEIHFLTRWNLQDTGIVSLKQSLVVQYLGLHLQRLSKPIISIQPFSQSDLYLYNVLFLFASEYVFVSVFECKQAHYQDSAISQSQSECGAQSKSVSLRQAGGHITASWKVTEQETHQNYYYICKVIYKVI